MPRAARLDIPGVLQHVIVRGIERCDIFLDDQDRALFLGRLSSLLKETGTRCYAWSLLSNHFHLLLMPTTQPLSLLMRRLLTGYAIVFNRKYGRSGHLFQNRYKSIVCEEELYLLELVRYIHLNPLRAGLVADMIELDRYPWSGHAALMGERRLEGQETGEILQRFGSDLLQARRNYRQFVADGIPAGRRDDLVGGGLRRSLGEQRGESEGESFDARILGSGLFVERLQRDTRLSDKIKRVLPIPELLQRICTALQLEADAVRRPSKSRALAEARGLVCHLAIHELGHKGTEVGRELRLGPAGVSIAARRGEKAIQNMPGLKELVLLSKLEK